MPYSAPPSLTAGRLIASALTTGVVTLWVVAWIVTRGGTVPLAPEPPLSTQAAFWVWATVALSGFGAALFFRGKALEVAGSFGSIGKPSAEALTRVQTYLVVAWALLEGPALLSGVFLLLLAAKQILWWAAAVYALGVVLTFPRPEWYGERG